MSPNCFGASWGRNLDTCSKLHIYIYGYCNVVTLVNKHKIYNMWVLQCYLQLLEQYLALCYILRVIYNVKKPSLQYFDTFKTKHRAKYCSNNCKQCCKTHI